MIIDDVLETLYFYNRPMTMDEIGSLLLNKYKPIDIIEAVWTGLDDDVLKLTPDKRMSVMEKNK